MTLTDWVAAIALLVSFASAVIAWGAKKQAKKAATLEPRMRAIRCLRAAVSHFNNDRAVTSAALVSIREADGFAEVVFSKSVRRDLKRALQKTEKNVHTGGLISQKIASDIASDLQGLIDRMNREAELAPRSDDL